MVMDTKSSSFIKKQKISWCNILVVFKRIFGQIDLGLHSIVPFINTAIALSKAG